MEPSRRLAPVEARAWSCSRNTSCSVRPKRPKEPIFMNSRREEPSQKRAKSRFGMASMATPMSDYTQGIRSSEAFFCFSPPEKRISGGDFAPFDLPKSRNQFGPYGAHVLLPVAKPIRCSPPACAGRPARLRIGRRALVLLACMSETCRVHAPVWAKRTVTRRNACGILRPRAAHCPQVG